MGRRYGNGRRRYHAPSPRPSMGRRLWDILLAVVLLVLIAVLVVRLDQSPKTVTPSAALTGRAYVIDGDTISINRIHIRLKGIDAPELKQTCGAAARPCGQEARQSLIRLIGGRDVRCSEEGRDRYDRVLAICLSGETELNRSMVGTGQAVSYGDYAGAEMEARAKSLGLWKGDFERPSDWRRRNQEVVDDFDQPDDATTTPLDRLWNWFVTMMGGTR
jgi:endonuclease YncB( thermonuclease family)